MVTGCVTVWLVRDPLRRHLVGMAASNAGHHLAVRPARHLDRRFVAFSRTPVGMSRSISSVRDAYAASLRWEQAIAKSQASAEHGGPGEREMVPRGGRQIKAVIVAAVLVAVSMGLEWWMG